MANMAAKNSILIGHDQQAWSLPRETFSNIFIVYLYRKK